LRGSEIGSDPAFPQVFQAEIQQVASLLGLPRQPQYLAEANLRQYQIDAPGRPLLLEFRQQAPKFRRRARAVAASPASVRAVDACPQDRRCLASSRSTVPLTASSRSAYAVSKSPRMKQRLAQPR
jgi:hypothetical protein